MPDFKPKVVLVCDDLATEMSRDDFFTFWDTIRADVEKATTRFVFVAFTLKQGWYVIGSDDETDYRRLFEKAGLN